MNKILSFPFLVITYCLIYFYNLKISLVEGSDDTWFADISKQEPYFQWIASRYNTWSGRLFPDTMLYALLDKYTWIWRIVSSLLLLMFLLYIVKILKKDATRKDFILSVIILGYLSINVLNAGFFWITGSINYLWPISLGLIAMFPYANQIFDYNLKLSPLKFIIPLVAGVLASISNEQAALCMSAFSLLSFFILLFKRKMFHKGLFLLTIVIIAGTCILIFAPGNKVRWVSEVNTWFPGYEHLTLLDKVHLGIIWLYQQLFVELRNLIILLSLIIFAIYYKDHEKNKIPFYTFSVLLFTAISTLFLGQGTDILYDFQLINEYSFSQNIFHFWNSYWGFVHAIFPYFFWTIYSMLLLYLIFIKSKHKFFIFLCLSAAISTFTILFFSPTIYASGPRTLTVGSVLIYIVIMKLLFDYNLINSRLKMIVISCLPLLNLLKLFVSL